METLENCKKQYPNMVNRKRSTKWKLIKCKWKNKKNQQNGWLFENTNKTGKPLFKLDKGKKGIQKLMKFEIKKRDTIRH